jgi:hypothetical protein
VYELKVRTKSEMWNQLGPNEAVKKKKKRKVAYFTSTIKKPIVYGKMRTLKQSFTSRKRKE